MSHFWFVLGTAPSHVSIPPNQNGTMINEAGKYSLKKEIQRWRPSSGVPRGCVIRIRLWPLRRNEGRRSDWPAVVVANDVSRKIDR